MPEKRSASSPEPEPPWMAPSVCTSQRGRPAKVPLGPSAIPVTVKRSRGSPAGPWAIAMPVSMVARIPTQLSGVSAPTNHPRPPPNSAIAARA